MQCPLSHIIEGRNVTCNFQSLGRFVWGFCLFVSTAIVEKDAEPEAPDDPRPPFCVLWVYQSNSLIGRVHLTARRFTSEHGRERLKHSFYLTFVFWPGFLTYSDTCWTFASTSTYKCVMGLLLFSPFPEAVAFFHFNHYFFPHVHVKKTIRKRPGPTSCAVQCCLHPKGKSALMTFRHKFFVTECER